MPEFVCEGATTSSLRPVNEGLARHNNDTIDLSTDTRACEGQGNPEVSQETEEKGQKSRRHGNEGTFERWSL